MNRMLLAMAAVLLGGGIAVGGTVGAAAGDRDSMDAPRGTPTS